MPLSDWQISYQGLVMGDGTDYQLVRLSGFEDLPDIDSADLEPVRHGLVRGVDYMRGRQLVAEAEITATSAAAFATAVTNLRTALAVQSQAEPALNFKFSGAVERLVYCRPRRRTIPVDFPFAAVNYARGVVLEWVATDPNVYDAVQTSTVLT